MRVNLVQHSQILKKTIIKREKKKRVLVYSNNKETKKERIVRVFPND